jgi:hypothetical protein
MLTLAFREWTSHGPASPQAYDHGIGAWKEETVGEKAHRRRSKKGINAIGGKEDGTA